MGRRRRRGRNRKRRSGGRRSEPGWYRQRTAKSYALKVTMLSLLSMLFLILIVPSIFGVAGGYDALVTDTQTWETLVADDFTESTHNDWGLTVNHGYTCTNTAETGHDHTTGVGFWTYPDEQSENFTTGLLDISGCSTTDGTTFGMWFYLNVDPADLITDNADQLKIKFRSSIGDAWVQFESECPSEVACDGGYWSTDAVGGIEHDFLLDDQYKHNYTVDKWLDLTYSWNRASLIQADQAVDSDPLGRFTLFMNLTDEAYSPMDWDGEIVDVWFGFFSEGGGISLWGDIFGWSLGVVMIVMAAASTPYWNPTRESQKRHWRRGRRY